MAWFCRLSKISYTPFANIYLAGQNALALKLAMDLARIFDLSTGKQAYPPEEQTKASIPVLAALLRRPGVQEGLAQDAGEGASHIKNVYTAGSLPPGVLEADLESSQREVSQRLPQGGHGLSRSRPAFGGGGFEREGRTWPYPRVPRLPACSFLVRQALPIYVDLGLLLDVAKEAAKHASLAVEGHDTDFDDLSREDRRNADRYYACVLDGLKREARGQ